VLCARRVGMRTTVEDLRRKTEGGGVLAATALMAYLHAWTRAGTAQQILEEPGG